MAAKLRPLKTDEEIKAIPVDQPVLIQLPAAIGNAEPEAPQARADATPQPVDDAQADPVKSLQSQLEAMKEAKRIDDAEKARLSREAQEAREAARRAEERAGGAEKDRVTSGLAQAQSEMAAAKTAYRIAAESGDFTAAGDAQEKISRAAAAIRDYEREGAEQGLRETERKTAPVVQQQPDMMASMEASPNLLPKEKEFFRAHPEALIDQRMNKRLDVAYEKAIERGLIRGTASYFDYIETEMGYKKPEQQQRQDDDDAAEEDGVMAAAPVTRQNGTMNGTPARADQVILTSEERELCANMGISEVSYAQNKIKMAQDKKARPEAYYTQGR